MLFVQFNVFKTNLSIHRKKNKVELSIFKDFINLTCKKLQLSFCISHSFFSILGLLWKYMSLYNHSHHSSYICFPFLTLVKIMVHLNRRISWIYRLCTLQYFWDKNR